MLANIGYIELYTCATSVVSFTCDITEAVEQTWPGHVPHFLGQQYWVSCIQSHVEYFGDGKTNMICLPLIQTADLIRTCRELWQCN